MGLFGKKKTPSEILAEGRALYERGEYGKAALTLLKATGKENGEIDYWIGRSYIAMDEKKGKAPSWTAKQYLQTAAENGYEAAAELLEEKFGTKDLSKNTPASVEEPTPVAAPVPESKSASVDEKPAPESQPSETKTEAVPETEEERYEKGMELFRAGKYDEAFQLLKRVCPFIGIRKKKYPVGQVTMGWMYEQGRGTEADASKAERHYRIAAQNGNQEGMRGYVRLVSKEVAPASDACQTALDYARQMNDVEVVAALEHRLAETQQWEVDEAEQKKLAEQYAQLFQEGVAAHKAGDYRRALELFEKLAEYGDAKAQYNCGVMYKNGEGTESDKKKALYWYGKAAEQGYVVAQYNCGEMCYYGEGTEINKEKALYWYEKAAEQGDVNAQFHCGAMYECGEGTERDKKKALYWYGKAGEQGDVTAQYNCGLIYYCGEFIKIDKKKALYWFEKAAEQGHAVARFLCGKMYEYGEGMGVDKKKALYWYEKAAEQGNVEAQFNCGEMYRDGEGTETDKKKALYWFEKAAEQGDLTAQFFCGEMYEYGEGTGVDKKKALYWYEKAAEQGFAEAQSICGKMYEDGEGTEADKKKALYWYEKAAEQPEP